MRREPRYIAMVISPEHNYDITAYDADISDVYKPNIVLDPKTHQDTKMLDWVNNELRKAGFPN